MKLKRLLPVRSWLPGASLVHTQKVIHIQGKDEQLVPIVQDLFGADLNVIKTKFQ